MIYEQNYARLVGNIPDTEVLQLSTTIVFHIACSCNPCNSLYFGFRPP